MCVLGLLADTVLALGNQYLPFDPPLTRAVQAISFGPLTRTFDFFTWLGGLRQFAAAVLAIGLVFALNRRATPLMAAGALTGALYQGMNLLIHRPRPSHELVHVLTQVPGYGYPSGHAAFFTSFSVLLLYCLGTKYLPRWGFVIGWLAAVLIISLACISRVYVGAHWPSDVLAGLFIGVGWTSLALAWRRISDPVLETSTART